MRPWLSSFNWCWNWLAHRMQDDVERTCIVECRPSVLETTSVLSCQPAASKTKPYERRLPRAQRVDWSLPRLSEKRIGVRYPCDREVLCRRLTSRTVNLNQKGRARNLSAGGIGLVVGAAVEPGTSLFIELPPLRNRSRRILRVRVVHSRPMPIRGWYLGCAFAENLSDGELKRLI